MKTIYDKAIRGQLITRIGTLDEKSVAHWGKMNVSQMLKHCTLYEELLLGKKKFKRSFLGLIFGKLALKDLIGDERELKHDMPTITEIRITGKDIDLASEKKKWISLLQEHAFTSAPNVVHPFCGKLTEEQIGYLSYKHTDHHLRQFGA